MTEALMTEASAEPDGLSATPDKTTTTVAVDFGRTSLDDDLILYLFGMPGQERFWFLWDDLICGALSAVVLADPRRLADCFPAIEYFENVPDTPFVVVLNCFDGILPHEIEEVRTALAIDPGVPLLTCDARDAASVARTLTELVRCAIKPHRQRPGSGLIDPAKPAAHLDEVAGRPGARPAQAPGPVSSPASRA